MSDLRKQVGDRIRDLRGKVSRDILGPKAGLSSRQLGKIERAEAGMRLETLGKIAGALGVEPYELLVPVDRLDVESAKRRAVIRYMQRTDPKGWAFVSDVIAAYLARRPEGDSGAAP